MVQVAATSYSFINPLLGMNQEGGMNIVCTQEGYHYSKPSVHACKTCQNSNVTVNAECNGK